MTTSYNVEIVLELDETIDADTEAYLDDVADAFADITDVDGDVGMNIATGRVELCMTVLAEGRADAIGKAISAARTAIHTAGGVTQGSCSRPDCGRSADPTVLGGLSASAETAKAIMWLSQ